VLLLCPDAPNLESHLKTALVTLDDRDSSSLAAI